MLFREKHHRLSNDLYTGHVSASFTLCIKDRRQILANREIVRAFTEALLPLIETARCIVPVYCFMPDHVHLVLTGTERTSNVRKTVIQYKQKTGFWMTREYPSVKWQKDFYDRIIRRDEDMAAHVRYILNNPVRKGIVLNWKEYPYKGSIGVGMDAVLGGII